MVIICVGYVIPSLYIWNSNLCVFKILRESYLFLAMSSLVLKLLIK